MVMDAKYKSKRDQIYNTRSSVISEEWCNHYMEPHTMYDGEKGGYLTHHRCRCNKHKLIGNKLFKCHAEAEAQAQAELKQRETE